MKKFVLMCLVAILFLSTFVGCEDIKYNNENDTNNVENSSTENSESNDNNNIEIVEPTELEYIYHYEIPDASFWRDKEGEYYIYIKEWQVYRKLSRLTEYPKNHIRIQPTSAVVNEDTAAIAVYIQSGKSDTKIFTYHFNRGSEEVQYYSIFLETREHNESNYFMINLHSENKGEFFFIPQFTSTIDGEKNWPIIRYETTDGGQTWNIAEVKDFRCSWRDYPTIVKFVTKETGIISYRYRGWEDLCGRTFLTTDGGLTWSRISQLPYPFDDICKVGYTEVHDLQQSDDGYLLTVKIRISPEYTGNEQLDFRAYIYFKSSDLVNWMLCEP